MEVLDNPEINFIYMLATDLIGDDIVHTVGNNKKICKAAKSAVAEGFA